VEAKLISPPSYIREGQCHYTLDVFMVTKSVILKQVNQMVQKQSGMFVPLAQKTVGRVETDTQTYHKPIFPYTIRTAV
jgi:hypothetical protein